MRVAVSKRLLTALCALGLLAAACAQPTVAEVEIGEGTTFIPAIVDFLDNTGVMPSVAVDADGIPFVSYFGFPAELGPDDIPVARPIGTPFVPSVLLASENDGIFTRGAVAMAEPPPTGVNIPFGPAEEPSLQSVTPDNVNGTAVAVDDQGGIHVAWVSDTGLWYGLGGAAGFSIEPVFELDPPLDQAGPLGAPAITVDADGNPWIALGVNLGVAQTVEVFAKAGERWSQDSAAELDRCSGCPQPSRVGIGVTGDGPVVAYADTAAGATMAASFDGKAWDSTEIEGGVEGRGLSMAVDGDGVPHVAYYSGEGEVHEALMDGAGWAVGKVADVGDAEEPALETTGIAVDDEGTSFVGFYDGGTDSVLLASAPNGEFQAVATEDTVGGGMPTVGVNADGSQVFLAWYDHVNENLNLGILRDAEGVALAQPSATPTGGAAPSPSPSGGAACEPKGSEADVAAPQGAVASGFDPTCLAVEADKPSIVTFDNQDPSIPHNWALYEDSGYTKSIAVGETITGPAQETIKVDPLKAASYYFRCDVHPTTMTGQFIAA